MRSRAAGGSFASAGNARNMRQLTIFRQVIIGSSVGIDTSTLRGLLSSAVPQERLRAQIKSREQAQKHMHRGTAMWHATSSMFE